MEFKNGRNLISTQYHQLWNLISRKRKYQYAVVLILIITTAFAEVFSLGAVVPFLGVLISPENVFGIEKLKFVWIILNVKSAEEVIFPVTAIFIIAAILAGILRISLLYFSTRLSFATGSDISVELYKRTLYQSYSIHVSRNSSEVISGVTIKANAIVGNVLQPILVILSSFTILVTISIGLILVEPGITFFAFGLFGLLYLVVAMFAKKRLLENGRIVAKSHSILQKALQEGLGSIRDVLLDGTQGFYVDLYKKSDKLYRKAIGNNQFISVSPKHTIETIGICFMAILAYRLSGSSTNLNSVIPILGTLAMGAQRILPVLQQLYNSWANLKNGKNMLEDVLELLDDKNSNNELYKNQENNTEIKFYSSIVLKNVSFRYGNNLPFVIKDLSFEIKKGSKIGFIGKTGSGKSTLIDIIMGLLQPSSGELLVDGRRIDEGNIRKWQKQIAHVPQSIFLADSSIMENIAFGIAKDEIDLERVKKSAEKAQISSHIESLPNGYNAFVGERGIRLSGGQRQRIGIARALYKNASVIIFDEATSALDNETEKEVMESIDNLSSDLTILMIAHRVSTLEKCHKVIDLNKLKI